MLKLTKSLISVGQLDDTGFSYVFGDNSWKIQSRSPLAPPHYIGDGAKVVNSIIMSGCEVFGTVENSILSSNVVVEKGAVIKNSVIMGDVIIEKDAVIEYSIIDENVKICQNARIGQVMADGKGIAVVGRNTIVGEDAVVAGGKIIDKDVIKEGK